MRSVPYAEVIINYIDIKLEFPNNTKLEDYKFVEVDIKKGGLGFYIITNKRVTIQ
jgi:hypothetical protein